MLAVNEQLSNETILWPILMAPPSELFAVPSMTRFEKETVYPASIEKTLTPPPLNTIESPLVGTGPIIARSLSIGISDAEEITVLYRLVENTIVSPGEAVPTASLNVPVPDEVPLVTVIVAEKEV